MYKVVEINKILKIASSKKGKYTAKLIHDCNINNKKLYVIKEYTYSSQRGSYNAGNNLKLAINKFGKYVEDWNHHNVKLGKLYIK